MATRNSILVIRPYRYSGTWVFDDPGLGLSREPFVAGVPEIIDRLVRHIPNATGGFRLLFSAMPFPACQATFERGRQELGGVWYRSTDDPTIEGWLCPALFRYFPEAPEKIYVKAEALN